MLFILIIVLFLLLFITISNIIDNNTGPPPLSDFAPVMGLPPNLKSKISKSPNLHYCTHWGYHYKIPITTKSPSLGDPHVYLPLGPLPPPAGASTVCGTIPKFFFLAFLPPFLYAHTLSDSSNRIRTPRLHYKTDVKTTPLPFSHKLFLRARA